MYKSVIVSAFTFLSAIASAANLCNEGRLPNFSFPARTAPTAIFAQHEQGVTADHINYAGPGYCYKAPKAEGVSMEDSYAQQGLLRGLTEAAYLLKSGDKHTLVHRGRTAYVSENECPYILREDHVKAQRQLMSGGDQDSEVRMIPGRLGFSVVVENISTYVVCYFPIR